jgi:hypothetical protein
MKTTAITDKLSLHTSGEATAALEGFGEKVDENTGQGYNTITVEKKQYKYYPWGKNNRLPHDMMKLVRSNGDVANLLETRADFLYGSGIGFFTRNEAGEAVAFTDEKLKQLWLDLDMDDLVDGLMTQIVFTGHGFINVSAKDNILNYSLVDSLVVRAVVASETERDVSKYVLSSRWDEFNVRKNGVVVNSFDYAKPYGLQESLVNLHKPQPGQFYYNFPQWWALVEWIKLANRIPILYSNNLDTEGNVGMVLRVAEKLFDIAAQNAPKDSSGKEMSKEDLIDAFRITVDKFLFGTDKNKILLDVCGVDADGKLEKWIEFEPVKKTMTGEQYSALYTQVLQALSGATGILGGLAGVSDGKMNSGGGTEIRQTALYQQFYRTPRERKLILNFLNRVFVPDAQKRLNGLPSGIFCDFKNIVLETLDKNPTGIKSVKSNAN